MHVNSHASGAYFLYLWKERMHTTTCSQRKPIVVQGVNQQWFTSQPLQVRSSNLQWSARRPILVAPQTYIRLLLRVGTKVADEWQISLDYVRGSNIYVRGYLDLRAWSLRLRAQTEENHYAKALFSSREWYFFLRWIRGIFAIRRRACVSLRRGISGSWVYDALAL